MWYGQRKRNHGGSGAVQAAEPGKKQDGRENTKKERPESGAGGRVFSGGSGRRFSGFLCVLLVFCARMDGSERSDQGAENTNSRHECAVVVSTYEEGIGVRRVRQLRQVRARQTSPYLDHWQDEMDHRAGVQQLVPRLVPEQLGAGRGQREGKQTK